MRLGIAWIFVVSAITVISCKKHTSTPPVTPPPPVKKALLKDLTEAHLPDPYYHFEYGPDSQVIKASFNSDLLVYDVVYDGKNISEMRVSNWISHDTLRYVYDNAGKVGLIKYINRTAGIYRLVIFTYTNQLITNIEWLRKVDNVGYITYRTLAITYFPDGNAKDITEHRPPTDFQTEATYTTQYDQYDDKINVEEFTLWHDGINDQLFLLPGMHIQKNNPRKEVRTGDGINYVVDYSYTYNNDDAPITKTGAVLFTQGPEAGQRFETNSSYTYY